MVLSNGARALVPIAVVPEARLWSPPDLALGCPGHCAGHAPRAARGVALQCLAPARVRDTTVLVLYKKTFFYFLVFYFNKKRFFYEKTVFYLFFRFLFFLLFFINI